MSSLSTAENMMDGAYGIYLANEHSLDFSTKDKYRRQLRKHFKNPDQNEAPPHSKDAKQEIQDYTS